MSERCDICGANLALVGRVHRCAMSVTVKQAASPVTKIVEPNKVFRDKRGRGRPCLGDVPMSAAERQRKRRAAQKAATQ